MISGGKVFSIVGGIQPLRMEQKGWEPSCYEANNHEKLVLLVFLGVCCRSCGVDFQ